MTREINFYQIDPYTNRKRIVVKNGIAVKDHWCVDHVGNRHHIQKGTKVDELGLPIKERKYNSMKDDHQPTQGSNVLEFKNIKDLYECGKTLANLGNKVFSVEKIIDTYIYEFVQLSYAYLGTKEETIKQAKRNNADYILVLKDGD